MAVIKTKLNAVFAYEPQAGDTHVLTLIRSPTQRYVLTTRPIEEYADAVAWAVSMADQMAQGITVLPVTITEFITATQAQLENGLASMTDEERAEMRQVVVTRMLLVMRDSDDPALRAEAYQVLEMFKET